MNRTKRAYLTPSQLGALTGYGMAEVQYGKRGELQLVTSTDSNKVWSKIATDDDGNEMDVLLFPPAKWEDILDTLGVDDTDQDMVKMDGTIWMKDDSR